MKVYISSAASMIPRSLNWVYQYYDIVSTEDLKSMLGISSNEHLVVVEDLKDSYPGYKTVCHLVAKDEFLDFLQKDGYDFVEVIKEPYGGPYFLGEIIDNQVFDITEGTKAICLDFENYIMQMY